MNEQQPATQGQIAKLESQIKAMKAQLTGLEKGQDGIKKDVFVLKTQNDEFDRKQESIILKQEEARIRELDTNRNAHEAKHGMLNVKNNLESFVRLREDDQTAFRKLQEGIQQLFQMQPLMKKMSDWMEDFQGLETKEGWKDLMKETKDNTDFRKTWTSYKGLIPFFVSLFSLIIAAFAVAKLLGFIK